MVLTRILALTAACALFGACSGDEEADAKGLLGDAAGKLDDLAANAKGTLDDLASKADSLSADELKSSVGDVVGNLTEKLGEVKDKASATEIADGLKGALDSLGSLKSTLGDKMPDLSALGDAATSLKEKFAGKQDVLDALKPLLEQIQNLVG